MQGAPCSDMVPRYDIGKSRYTPQQFPTTYICCGEHQHMLWTTLKNRHPQHIVTHNIYDEWMLSTTYPHNICAVSTTYRHPQPMHSTAYSLSPTSYVRRCPQCIQNGYPYNIYFGVFTIWWRSFLLEYYRLWSACDILWGTGGTCCGEHPWHSLWVTCCGQHQKHMLWGTRVSPTTYARCSPQHI